MNTRTANARPLPAQGDRLTRWLKARLLPQLDRLEGGEITLIEGHQRHRLGRGGPLSVTLVVRDSRAWRRMALGGTVGAGEAYMDGDWDADDPVALVRLFAANLERVNGEMEGGLAGAGRWLLGALYRLQRNSLSGSRRNIAAHYDIGNDLFATFLDRRHWMYSSAVFPRTGASLEEASTHKLDLMLERLDVRPHHHLLEIGTGWGGLAIHAARTRGCRVTTTTISDEQYAHTARRLAEEGLEDRVTLLKRDYRELEGRFDRLISVEMIEAVGHQYLETYLTTLDRLLTDDGMAMLQAITIRDQRYEAAKREMDFIKRYIFPGGFLPSQSVILDGLTRHTSLNLVGLEEIGQHYARTLREWRHRFEANLETVRRLGYDERFIRMWRYYLCYCEGGFLERTIGTSQLLLAKPGARPAPLTGAA
ncbi:MULTISPECIES: SAM-dependent methyltransferase [Halomonas]|uniref:Cyclopropane-fatty-acyl-phospholipid synthase n=1 Tax=Halomonas halophila TaxID=29573 RepID=A0ABQ0U7D1_9GAMM|nr:MULTISPECIES: cyclopropane-fatty-acyl-phospholipid synthase family protein [Halomonas]MDR5890447.1 cyclopropane-fatty-acyl-phospholipid synthase family protein [Halomonas salina]WJY07028.1 cyclopropane-fatty-acyl-phospholipid synthase family protein [Halomonas halophila]GEK74429.1 cyclopropane-fatty-acyl-phospholipid synthase [Halomonas halophila]